MRGDGVFLFQYLLENLGLFKSFCGHNHYMEKLDSISLHRLRRDRGFGW